MAPDERYTAIRIKDAKTVVVGQEELSYVHRTRPIILNRSDQRAIYLQAGQNNHAFIQHINKDSNFSKKAPYWARLDHWKVVAVVEHFTAYREQPKPAGMMGRAVAWLFQDLHKPVCEWLGRVRMIAPEKQCPATCWGGFSAKDLGLEP